MTGVVLTILYLFVSVESVALQVVSLMRLRGGLSGPVHRHLVRTVATRVVVMSVYVVVAVVNLLTHSLLSPSGTAIFTAVAVVWQLNSLADARLGRDLAHSNQSGGRSMIRAKFKCISQAQSVYGQEGAKTYRFQAMYDPNLPEDQRFAKATPSGSLEILVDNPSAQFELGQDYYLDFTKVEQEAGA